MDGLTEPHEPIPDCDCHRCAITERDKLRNRLFDKRVEAHDLKHVLKTLLCDSEESEYMTGKEREQKARQLLVDLGE